MQQPDILSKRLSASVSERCIILCAYAPDDLPSEVAYRLRDTIDQLDSDGWWFFNPGTFIVAIRSSRSGATRAEACYATLRSLPNSIAGLGRFGVGGAEGLVLTSLASEGHLDTPPLGETVNAAFRQASKNAS